MTTLLRAIRIPGIPARGWAGRLVRYLHATAGLGMCLAFLWMMYNY